MAAPPPSFGPGAPPPYPVPRASAARLEEVRFEPDAPELALMTRTGEMPVQSLQRFRHVWYYERGFVPIYSPVCDGPCTTQLPAGTYHFAIAKDGGRAVPAGGVALQGPATIRASYDDRSGVRIAGDVILVAGIVGGIAMVVASADHKTCDDFGCSSDVNGALLGGGIAVIIGSAIVGTILASQRDRVRGMRPQVVVARHPHHGAEPAG